MTPLILASGSATRLEMLRQAGVHVSVERPNVDEASAIESLVAEKARPRDIADYLAGLKSVRVSTRHAGAMVIGADQVLSLGPRVFQKPSNRLKAREHLLALRGQTHTLSSAACVSRVFMGESIEACAEVQREVQAALPIAAR